MHTLFGITLVLHLLKLSVGQGFFYISCSNLSLPYNISCHFSSLDYPSKQSINASCCSNGLILECFRQAWDLAVDTCLSQLHDVVSGKKTFQVRLLAYSSQFSLWKLMNKVRLNVSQHKEILQLYFPQIAAAGFIS